MERLFDLITGVIERLIFIILLSMTSIMFANVVGRYGFGTAISWVPEVARMLFVWLTFLAVILGVRQGAHIGLGFAVERLSPRWRPVVDVVATLLILGFCAVWFWTSLFLVERNADMRSALLGIPMWLLYLATPVSVAAIFLLYAARLAVSIRALRRAFHGGRAG